MAAEIDIGYRIKDPDLLSFFDAQLDEFTKDVPKKRGPNDTLPLHIPRFRSGTVFANDEDL